MSLCSHYQDVPVLGWLLGLVIGSCAIAASFPIPVANGHQPAYLVRSWQTENGLPQNSVCAIVQTPDGYLWLGTFNGVVRFDGVKCTTFSATRNPGLRSDNIDTLHLDRQNRLWIGTEGGGLSCLQGNTITPCDLGPLLSNSSVTDIAEDAGGILWIATSAHGLHRYDPRRSLRLPPLPGQTNLQNISGLCQDVQGQIWIAAEGLFRCDNERLIKELDFSGRSFLAPHREKGVWLALPEVGLVHHWGQDKTIYPQAAGIPLKSLYQTRDGIVWLAVKPGPLRRFDHGELHPVHLGDEYRSAEIICFQEDNEGALWLGSNGGGLMQLRPKYVQTYSTKNGLYGNDVVCVLPDQEDRIWIGTYDQGVARFDGNQWHRVPGLPGSNATVYALAASRNGALWLGDAEGYLYHWAPGTPVRREQLETDGSRVLFEDRQGSLWLGSRHHGLELRAMGRSTRFDVAQGLSHPYVTALAQTADGAVWAGTRQGLNRVSWTGVRSFFKKDGLGADSIHTLYADPGGTLWIGTAGGGLSRLRQGRLTTLTAQQGLIHDVVAQLIEDDQGGFWIGSNGGLQRLERQQLDACLDGQVPTVHGQIFNRQEALPHPEFAGGFQPACGKTRDGRLWFATVGGLVVINPTQIPRNRPPPPVIIEHIEADGVTLTDSPRWHESQTPILIPPNSGRVQIAYTGLSYSAPERMQFRFQLKGWDRNWEFAGTRRVAYYSHLAPGYYRFQVTANNADGAWNEIGALIDLRVLPAWWQTWTFRGLILAGGMLAFWLVTLKIHRRNLQHTLALAEQQSAQQRAQELGATNAQLQTRTRELEEALSKVKQLHGLIPICASCKKVRDDKGYWNQVEKYIQDHSEATFSHGLCPDCIKRYYGRWPEETRPAKPS